MKLAIFFPGIGYTNDKPIMYYCRKIVRSMGYDELCVEYRDLPKKVLGSKERLLESANLSFEQAKQQLSECDFAQYDEILLVGKSIGTCLAAKIAKEVILPKIPDKVLMKMKLIFYTPLEETFSYYDGNGAGNAIAFIGDKDPWSVLDEVKRLAADNFVPLHLYPDCNHSLETDDALRNIEILGEVLRLTQEFLS